MDGFRQQNCETREPHIATNPLAHPPTDRPNDQPSRTSVHTHHGAGALVVSCAFVTKRRRVAQKQCITSTIGVYGQKKLKASGRSDVSQPPPRSSSSERHPLFAGDTEGLLCGWVAAAQRGRGRPSGGRKSQLFLWYVRTGMYSNIHLDMTTTTTTTEEHYTPRIT